MSVEKLLKAIAKRSILVPQDDLWRPATVSISKSGYQLLRDLAGGGSRRRASLTVDVKAASELEIAHKVAKQKKASRRMGA